MATPCITNGNPASLLVNQTKNVLVETLTAYLFKEFGGSNSDGSGVVKVSEIISLLKKLNPDFTELELATLHTWIEQACGQKDAMNYADFVNCLYSSDTDKSRQAEELNMARQELASLRKMVKRQPFTFTVGQYNILAGYMGTNMEPWFLYGVDMPEDRRQRIIKKHGERGPDGKPVNAGWPAYVNGILSDEEQRKVEQTHRDHFAWDKRKDRILDVIDNMDADLISLVECDHYEDHFKPMLECRGYGTQWRKRPRPASKDGCCVAWRTEIFECQGCCDVEYVDRFDPEAQRSFKDRIALICLLRVKMTRQAICFVSTHLQRNPEDPNQDALRARQVGQVMRSLATFLSDKGEFEAPVIFTGDLNCTSFERLRGIANVVSLLNRCTLMHPFSWDCADVPTGPTSVTTARCMRIDAILYQSQMLELVDADAPEIDLESPPIPNAEHPSDHVPVVAQFRMRSRLHSTYQLAKEWYFTMAGQVSAVPLNRKQLLTAFKLYDYDGTGQSTPSELCKVFVSLLGSLPKEASDVVARLPDEGVDFKAFCTEYHKAVGASGIPGIQDFKAAFEAFDTDKDGSLDFEEMLAVFRNCSPGSVSEEGLEDLFKVIDTSGDGRIDLDEMIHHLSKVWADSFMEEERKASKKSTFSLSVA